MSCATLAGRPTAISGGTCDLQVQRHTFSWSSPVKSPRIRLRQLRQPPVWETAVDFPTFVSFSLDYSLKFGTAELRRLAHCSVASGCGCQARHRATPWITLWRYTVCQQRSHNTVCIIKKPGGNKRWYSIAFQRELYCNSWQKKVLEYYCILLSFTYSMVIINCNFIITSSFDSLNSFTSWSLWRRQERYTEILLSFLHSTISFFCSRGLFFFLGIKHQSAFQCFSFSSDLIWSLIIKQCCLAPPKHFQPINLIRTNIQHR